MAEKSAISWTKSTFNPWIGCTKVGPGCDHCYAAVSTAARSMSIKWGASEPRYRTSIKNWNQPIKWNRQALDSEFAGSKGFWPVFCASLADVFDNEVPTDWRDDLWALIKVTPNLTWLLVTKRVGNVAKMLPVDGLPSNVWLIITVVNQDEADRDIPKLMHIEATVRGISYEPALEAVIWPEGLDWIIIGGESDQGNMKARPFNISWAHEAICQCQRTGAAAFVKQLGSNVTDGENPLLFSGAAKDMSQWPESLRVQNFPRPTTAT